MITVYIDVLFVINFIINILIVEATGLVMGEETKWYRTILSAFLGAIYAVGVFFVDLIALTGVVMKILVSGIMVSCAFPKRVKRHFFKMWASFYLVSFIFGGALFALMSMTGIGAKTGAMYSNGTVYFNLPWKLLLISSAGTYFLISAFSRIRRRKLARDEICRTLKIYINGAVVETSAIIDTGNSLFDPITGVPVIVCEYHEIEKLLPMGESVVERMRKGGLKIRLIPFSSVGKDTGVMPAFLPDRVEIDKYEAKRCVVGVSENPLSKGDYHALLNPLIITK